MRNERAGITVKNVPIKIDNQAQIKQNAFNTGLYAAYQVKAITKESCDLLEGFAEAYTSQNIIGHIGGPWGRYSVY